MREASPEHANGMCVTDRSGVENDPKARARSDSSNKYLSPKNGDDPKEMKRQIKFKEQVMKTLRESCNAEISKLQQEVDGMKTKLAARKRLAMTDEVLHMTEDKECAALKAALHTRLLFVESLSCEALLKDKKKKRKILSLHDDYLEAIAARRSRIEKKLGPEKSASFFEKEKEEWWRNRATVDKKALIASKWAALLGLFGTICSVVQNELIMQSMAPNNLVIVMLKMINTASTVHCLLVIYRLYWLRIIVFRLNRHCRRLVPLNTHVGMYDIFSQRTWWIEFVVVGSHCPPFYTEEYTTGTFSNNVVY